MTIRRWSASVRTLSVVVVFVLTSQVSCEDGHADVAAPHGVPSEGDSVLNSVVNSDDEPGSGLGEPRQNEMTDGKVRAGGNRDDDGASHSPSAQQLPPSREEPNKAETTSSNSEVSDKSSRQPDIANDSTTSTSTTLPRDSAPSSGPESARVEESRESNKDDTTSDTTQQQDEKSSLGETNQLDKKSNLGESDEQVKKKSNLGNKKSNLGESVQQTTTKSRGNAKKVIHTKADISKVSEQLGEAAGSDAPNKAKSVKAKAKAKAKAGATSVKGEAYIPLSPTIPKLTVVDLSTVKGLLQVATPGKRQFHVNKYADVSGTLAGAAVFGGNAHMLNAKNKDVFKFSNTHGQIGAMAFATHYPHYNKASVISSGTTASQESKNFVPRVVTTFTGKGDVGIGVTGPASRLHVQGSGNTRLINANHWADLSGCASGIGLVAGNAYVTTENNEARFRYSNSHSSMGAIGFAVNFPDWNKASIVTSGTKAAQGKKSFKPKVVATFTHDGLVGMGTPHPKALLHLHSASRQLSVNNWVDISSQGSAGFIGLNAHLVLKGSKRFFAFSNTAKSIGAIGVATNFPVLNQLSIVSSKATSSSKGTLFKPQAIATFTSSGFVGFGTDVPKAKLDVRHKSARQISANKYADVSSNDQLQGFFGGNGYAVGRQFAFANTHGVVGAVGLATHYPSPGHAAIISSANQQPKANAPFKPKVLVQFKPDGSLLVPQTLVVKGDIRVTGRLLSGDDSREYDFMAAHEALVQENMDLRTRLTKMEAMMATLSMAKM